MYMPLISGLEGINTEKIHEKEQEAEDKGVHPLDRNECPKFLRSVTTLLHANAHYLEEHEQAVQYAEERLLVRWEPYIILRKRPDGTVKALEAIEDDIDQGKEIPSALSGILGEFPDPPPGEEGEGGYPSEEEDFLLPKPANQEQIQIVRRINHSPAVLVQGPPGTGKTHTIANLLSHFLAEGKTVLVTSHTSKALTVLKDKVPDELKPLCVSVFGDNRADMEQSVDEIIKRTTEGSSYELKADVERLKKLHHRTLA